MDRWQTIFPRPTICKMRRLVGEALAPLDPVINEIYADSGRPSIAPERLIRASLLQVIYSIRSERPLMEKLDYNLMFRWFVGLSVDEPVWNPPILYKYRDRLAQADGRRRLFKAIVERARRRNRTSTEHFSIDGSLIAAWASQKSARHKDCSDNDNPDGFGRNAVRNFQGEKRSNTTHASRSDPEAMLATKSHGIATRPSYMGHNLMENRHGLLINAELTSATGTAERDAAIEMGIALNAGATLGADKGNDTRDSVEQLEVLAITPHVAQNLTRLAGSAIDGRTTRHPAYMISQRIRKRAEEPFGWAKQIGCLRQTKSQTLARVRQDFLRVMSAYNLVHIRNLTQEPAS